jgi:membrane protein implicated in regulation of membrane protease activity
MLAQVLDLGIDLDVWPWVSLIIAVFFAVIELTALAGSFVLLPFAVSAFIASLLGFYDAPIEVQWFAFVVGGGVLWIATYRVVQRFSETHQRTPGIGADRLVGLTGIVTSRVDPDDAARRGRVTIDGEIWGALSDGRVLEEGTKVRVVEMHGTRVRVVTLDADADSRPTPAEDP